MLPATLHITVPPSQDMLSTIRIDGTSTLVLWENAIAIIKKNKTQRDGQYTTHFRLVLGAMCYVHAAITRIQSGTRLKCLPAEK